MNNGTAVSWDGGARCEAASQGAEERDWHPEGGEEQARTPENGHGMSHGTGNGSGCGREATIGLNYPSRFILQRCAQIGLRHSRTPCRCPEKLPQTLSWSIIAG
jgi:hypothetical protein